MTELYSLRTPGSFTIDYEALAFVIRQLIGRMITMVPVRVVAVTNSGSLTSDPYVNVQPLLEQMTGDQQGVPHGVIYNVPCWRLRGGTSAVIVDPVAGDVGMMVVAYRDSSSLAAQDKAAPGSLQGGSSTYKPGSQARYDWGSGVYLGGILNGAISQYLQLTATECKIVAPTISLNGLTIDSSGNLNTSGSVTSNGTVLHAHEHSAGTYVAPGGGGAVTGDSGQPI